MIKSNSLSTPYGIIFVYDYLGDIEIVVPEYESGTLVQSNENCISIGVQPEIDGDVSIHLTDDIGSFQGIQNFINVFVGDINCPSRALGISTSDEEAVLEFKCDDIAQRIAIYVDHKTHPSEVVIEILK